MEGRGGRGGREETKVVAIHNGEGVQRWSVFVIVGSLITLIGVSATNQGLASLGPLSIRPTRFFPAPPSILQACICTLATVPPQCLSLSGRD
jgi:hypothetical protein